MEEVLDLSFDRLRMMMMTMIQIPPRKDKVHTKFVVTSVTERKQYYTHISIKSLLIAINRTVKYGFFATGFFLV